MIGHFEKKLSDVRTRKHKGLEKGSARLPYNFATLTWDDDAMPVVTIFLGTQVRRFKMEHKVGKTATSAQFEFYGVGDRP